MNSILLTTKQLLSRLGMTLGPSAAHLAYDGSHTVQAFLCAGLVHAKTAPCTIIDRVTATSGYSLVGAWLNVQSSETEDVRHAVTDAKSTYGVLALPPSPYTEFEGRSLPVSWRMEPDCSDPSNAALEIERHALGEFNIAQQIESLLSNFGDLVKALVHNCTTQEAV